MVRQKARIFLDRVGAWRLDGRTGRAAGPAAPRRDRQRLAGRDPREGPRRRHHRLEPRGGATVRAHRGGGDRPPGVEHHHPARSRRGGAGPAAARTRRRARPGRADRAAAPGRLARAGVAHDGAHPRRGRPRDRRLDDGARRDRVAARGGGAHAPGGNRPIDRATPSSPWTSRAGSPTSTRRPPRCSGLAPDSIGTSVLDAVGADESARARRADIVRRAGGGRDTRLRGAPHSTAPGRDFVLANTIGPIHDDDGEITGIAAIARDVTEQRKAQEQQRWLAAVVDSSRDAIIGLGLDGTIVSWNPGAARMFGWPDEEAIGRRQLTCSSRRDGAAGTSSSCAASPPATPSRTRRSAGAGGRRDVRGDRHRLPRARDAHGTVHAAAFIVRDVTEQPRARGAAADQGRKHAGRRAASPAASPTTSTTC